MALAETSVRVPQQARSREKVARVVDAAETILVGEGYDALTIRRIAEVAGVPTGTIYQFFADKQDVVDVLARRYLALFDETMTSLLTVPAVGLDDLTDAVLDAFLDLYRRLPGYRKLWLGRHLSNELLEADLENTDLVCRGLAAVLVAHGLVRPDDETLLPACRVAVLSMESVIGAAFRRSDHGDDALISQGRAMVSAFFRQRAGAAA